MRCSAGVGKNTTIAAPHFTIPDESISSFEVMGSCWLWSEFYNSKVAKCWVILHVIELTYILIPFMLSKVSVEVKPQCIEKDCLGDHIRVVNRTTGNASVVMLA